MFLWFSCVPLKVRFYMFLTLDEVEQEEEEEEV